MRRCAFVFLMMISLFGCKMDRADSESDVHILSWTYDKYCKIENITFILDNKNVGKADEAIKKLRSMKFTRSSIVKIEKPNTDGQSKFRSCIPLDKNGLLEKWEKQGLVEVNRLTWLGFSDAVGSPRTARYFYNDEFVGEGHTGIYNLKNMIASKGSVLIINVPGFQTPSGPDRVPHSEILNIARLWSDNGVAIQIKRIPDNNDVHMKCFWCVF